MKSSKPKFSPSIITDFQDFHSQTHWTFFKNYEKLKQENQYPAFPKYFVVRKAAPKKAVLCKDQAPLSAFGALNQG